MIEKSIHDIHVTAYTDGPLEAYPWIEVDVTRYPDGSVKNHLSPDELDEVGDELKRIADQLRDD